MSKKPKGKVIGFRPDDELRARIERVAELDHRTVANLLDLCARKYLPVKEAELGIIVVDPNKIGSRPGASTGEDEHSVIAERPPGTKSLPPRSLEKPRKKLAR